ncbi:sigma-70 family RNA polymerase sigma factor [Synechococcus sp. Cruz-9H2]|uniref:sigma-70 family RNA polymerase sigma factor n=1 Tax=unclassified Synechococcus TaxID=2626047 RepID=UPI0020CE011F|nr:MULTISPECIES: sigma-70 family RNA polymerase sigma factor [unclassified Synechococcus]MCP9818057.1 sigma-70 family RNA polymerase sigma factor [Synechococcus sp. Cruz-9H2]MCP9842443.1 sigma-70 family RNA polymerase sigma factor [Synechococcus sp. Edmonson 11F2]MCP9854453.1 sigma-70 family RNA polymerase sigma factor [Synechococcus sp. Cruz-9C9]MCP9861851.1 sigma-70 family RNA polymerase sigma factor [Synechococcus sp. Cruz-7E5]
MTSASLVQSRPSRSGLSRRLRQRNDRVARHLELVRPIAHHYSSLCREGRDDLTQVGLLGLLRAAELFQSDQGTPFEAFARHHIRGAILHYLRDQAPVIRLPRRQRELEDRLRRLQQNQAGGSAEGSRRTEPLANSSLRRLLGLSEAQWQRFEQLRQLGKLTSLDGEEERIAATEPETEEGPGEGDAGDRIMALLAQLELRQRTAVQEVVLAGQSLRGTARKMQVSPMTVHRLLARALDTLRQRMEGESLSFSPDPGMHRGRSVSPAC